MTLRENDLVHRRARFSPPITQDDTCCDEVAIMIAARDNLDLFAPLYDIYFPRVYAYCARRVNTPEEAEDLTSRIFSRALSAIAQYRGGSVGAWLFRIARSVVANHHRDSRVTVPLDAVGGNIFDPSAPLDEHLAHADDIALARKLIAELSDDERELLDLRFNAALTSREIGTLTGQKAGTVRGKLYRIYEQLRARFEEGQS